MFGKLKPHAFQTFTRITHFLPQGAKWIGDIVVNLVGDGVVG